jgi:hypothetical protein
MSFVAMRRPAWWPAKDELELLPEKLWRVDQTNERYWSVWVDRQKGLLYAEYGRW